MSVVSPWHFQFDINPCRAWEELFLFFLRANCMGKVPEHSLWILLRVKRPFTDLSTWKLIRANHRNIKAVWRGQGSTAALKLISTKGPRHSSIMPGAETLHVIISWKKADCDDDEMSLLQLSFRFHLLLVYAVWDICLHVDCQWQTWTF